MSEDPHVPGVPQCPRCRTNYKRKEGETSARIEGRPYWVADCTCMGEWFQGLLREGKLKPAESLSRDPHYVEHFDIERDDSPAARIAADELTREAQRLGMEY